MTDSPTGLPAELFDEPTGESERAGLATWEPPPLAYRQFMLDEGIPIYEGIGVRNVRDLELGEWARLGARGAFLDLEGLEGLKGLHVLEVPGGGTTASQRHLYHEFYLVIEGRGTTETWFGDAGSRQIVEWGPGAYFYLPPNVHHRLVNATQDRALIIACNNAPPLFNLLRDRDFIFNNDYPFTEHFSPDPDFYRYDEKVYAVPNNKRAQARANYFPDIINAELPLDNQRMPGYRRIQPAFRGFEYDYVGFVAEYPVGRYSRAHHHPAGAVLVCLRGAGYTFTWPVRLGTTPWKDGAGEHVRVQEYEQGGLVAAAPGGGDWYHQHFAVCREPFRVLNYWGGPLPVDSSNINPVSGKSGNLNIRDGGNSVAYSDEDPRVREVFAARLAELGMTPDMDPELYLTD